VEEGSVKDEEQIPKATVTRIQCRPDRLMLVTTAAEQTMLTTTTQWLNEHFGLEGKLCSARFSFVRNTTSLFFETVSTWP
jgi:hypothetical protein